MPWQPSLTRRQALWLVGTLAGMGAVTRAKAAYEYYQFQALADLSRSFAVTGTASLNARAKAKGLVFGAAARQKDLVANADLANQYVKECGILVPEWELKWVAGNANLRPTPDTFDFSLSDWMANFAQTHGLLLRGHVLVWHLSLPSWFEKTVNSRNAEQFLVQHIQTVAGRYAGKMHSWDVVNEAIEPNDGRADGLRKTPWLEFLDTNYMDLAFRAAAEADPQATLTYNDYGLEYDTPADEAKRTAVLKLLERLKAKGTPIHAFGLQSHLNGRETRFNSSKLRRFLADIASLGLKIFVTELDVTDNELPQDPNMRDQIVASVYEDFLSVVLDELAVKALITWGLSDSYSWLAEFEPRSDGAAVRPLPLGANLERKLAWNAVARAIEHAPPR